MIEEKQMLESRLDKYSKEAAAGKLVKIRRYRMMACSVGVSVIVFAAYSIIFPVKAKEGAKYVINDNQALPLPSKTGDLTIQKEEIDKPAVKRNEETQKSLSSKAIKDNTKAAESVEASTNTVSSKKPSISTTKPKEKQEKEIPLEVYPEWNKNKTYQAGDRVMYEGKVYQANKKNKNEPPDESHVLFGSSWDEVKK